MSFDPAGIIPGALLGAAGGGFAWLVHKGLSALWRKLFSARPSEGQKDSPEAHA
jgi:hypothetical protein